MNESKTEEKRFSFFQRSNGRFVIFFMFYHCDKKISHSGINTLSLQRTCRTRDSFLVPRKPSVFFGCLRRLIVVYQSFEGILKVTLLTPFLPAYVERTEKGNESSTLKKEFISSKDPLDRSHLKINTFLQQIHLWCGLQHLLVQIILSFCQGAVTATAANTQLPPNIHF